MTDKRYIDSLVLDRRDFCGKLALAAAGTFVANVLPLPAAFAATEVTEAATSFGYSTLDDIAGNYPPYSEPIGYGRSHVTPLAANVAEYPFLA